MARFLELDPSINEDEALKQQIKSYTQKLLSYLG
jgi:hypothetical protein